MHNKTIKKVGTPEQLRSKYSKSQEISIETASKDYSKIIKELQKKKLDIKNIVLKDNKLIIYSPEAEMVLHRIVHIIEKNKEKLLNIDVNLPSLREIFESLVKK